MAPKQKQLTDKDIKKVIAPHWKCERLQSLIDIGEFNQEYYDMKDVDKGCSKNAINRQFDLEFKKWVEDNEGQDIEEYKKYFGKPVPNWADMYAKAMKDHKIVMPTKNTKDSTTDGKPKETPIIERKKLMAGAMHYLNDPLCQSTESKNNNLSSKLHTLLFEDFVEKILVHVKEPKTKASLKEIFSNSPLFSEEEIKKAIQDDMCDQCKKYYDLGDTIRKAHAARALQRQGAKEYSEQHKSDSETKEEASTSEPAPAPAPAAVVTKGRKTVKA